MVGFWGGIVMGMMALWGLGRELWECEGSVKDHSLALLHESTTHDSPPPTPARAASPTPSALHNPEASRRSDSRRKIEQEIPATRLGSRRQRPEQHRLQTGHARPCPKSYK